MLRQRAVVKSGDQLEVRALAALLVDYFLCIIEAAAALHFATERRISPLRRRRAIARGFAHFFLGDSVADADNHATAYKR